MADVASPIQNSSPVKVWLVDDNEQLRLLIAELLGRHDGIECARQFGSPDALLSTLASQPGPDVILLDVQMGDRNGLDAVRPIKSLTRSTRVLMFTTANNRAWREQALAEGASDYLLKSESLERVAARIRCPANDSNRQNYPRRRMQRPPAPPAADPSRPLLSRTLKKLRLW